MLIQKGFLRAKHYNSMNTAFYHLQCIPMRAIRCLRKETVLGRCGIPGAYDTAMFQEDLQRIRHWLHSAWRKIDEEKARKKQDRQAPAHKQRLSEEKAMTQEAFPIGLRGIVTVVERDGYPHRTTNHFVKVAKSTAKFLQLREYAIKSEQEVYVHPRPYAALRGLSVRKKRADWGTQHEEPALGERHIVSVKRAMKEGFGEQRRLRGASGPVLFSYVFETKITHCDPHGALLNWEERAHMDTDAVQVRNLGGRLLAGMSRDEAEANDANAFTLVRTIKSRVGTGSDITMITPDGVQLRPYDRILPLLMVDRCVVLTALFAPTHTQRDALDRERPLLSCFSDFVHAPNKAPILSIDEALDVDTI